MKVARCVGHKRGELCVVFSMMMMMVSCGSVIVWISGLTIY